VNDEYQYLMANADRDEAAAIAGYERVRRYDTVQQPRQIIYKTHEPSPQQVTTMHAGSIRDNDWFEKSFANFAAAEREWVMNLTADEREWVRWCLKRAMRDMAERIAELNAAEVKRLNDEIGKLRADLEVVRSIACGKTVNLRDRDAAA
jgi:hypothetical protein